MKALKGLMIELNKITKYLAKMITNIQLERYKIFLQVHLKIRAQIATLNKSVV